MSTPHSTAQSSSLMSLDSLVTMSAANLPVSLPSTTSRRLARQKSIPAAATILSAISWKPPLTTPTFQPLLCAERTSSSAPGVNVTRSKVRSNTLSSKPASSPTRSSSACLKSSSPRMARSVICATCSPTPASSPNRSMTSWLMSVESISITMRRAVMTGLSECGCIGAHCRTPRAWATAKPRQLFRLRQVFGQELLFRGTSTRVR